MGNVNPLNELGYGMKCFVAAQTSMNSNFGELSYRNGSIDTDNIMTLADYMKKERPEKLQNWNPEMHDDKKLMRTYVVPMTMPNGERIDVIVNAKGNDIAQIYVNESPENRFHLDKNIEEKIRLMTQGAIDQKARYREEFVPNDLDTLAEMISKDELIPKTTKNVEERKEKADEKSLETLVEEEKIEDKKEEKKEKEENEKTPEELASEAGVELSVLEKFCKENNLDIKNIKGLSRVKNSDDLENKFNKDFDIEDGEEILALRVDGINGKINATLALVDKDGETIDFDGKHDELLHELVPEGSEGREVVETKEKINDKVSLKDHKGTTDTFTYIDKNNENNKGNMEYLLEKYNKIQEKMKTAKAAIEGDTSLSEAEKSRMLYDLEANEYAQLEKLQNETGIQIPKLSDMKRKEAEDAAVKEEVEEVKEAVGTVGDATIGAVAVAAGIKAFDKDDDEPEAFEVPGKRKRE